MTIDNQMNVNSLLALLEEKEKQIKFLEEGVVAGAKDAQYYKSKIEKGVRVYAYKDADGYFLLDHPYSTNATLILDEVE